MNISMANFNTTERQMAEMFQSGVKLGRSGPELRPKVFQKGGARAPALVWASKSKSGWNYTVQL